MNIAIAVVVANLEDEVIEDIPRVFNVRSSAFNLSDALFRRNFRLNKNCVQVLIELVSPFVEAPSRLSALDVEIKVLVALNFYATGSYQTPVGNSRNLAISQSSVSRCITEITDILNMPEIFNHFVVFANNIEDLNRIRQNFFQTFGMPGVVGCVDCTHVAIVPPNRNDPDYPEHEYINRKGYHSINVQLICDSNLKIMNVNAAFGGRAHDSNIWNQSVVRQFMEELNERHPGYFLLGDSGYALRPWLLTPFQNPPPNSPEENFNNHHLRTRATIERCNGVLKMRFRCLLKHRVLHYKPTKASKIIKACVVLHNICIENNVIFDELGGVEDADLGLAVQNDCDGNGDLPAGRLFRRQIAARLPPF